MFHRLVAASMVLLSMAGCRQEAPVAKDAPAFEAGPVSPEETKTLVRGNTAFALALYDQVRQSSGNVILSPYSISSALAMTYDGARGETAQQMANVLRFPLDRKQLHPAFLDLNTRLAKRSD